MLKRSFCKKPGMLYYVVLVIFSLAFFQCSWDTNAQGYRFMLKVKLAALRDCRIWVPLMWNAKHM